MKKIDVQNQFRLGAARTFNLTVTGIRYRLFRSSVTVVVVSVAIAFLMNVLSEGLIMGSMGKMTRDRIREERQAPRWAARLSVPGTVEDIILEVARSGADAPIYAEGMKLGGLTPDEMRLYHENARAAAAYVDYFKGLQYAPRRILVHNALGTAIFDKLQDPAEFEEFLAALKDMKSLRFITSVDEFRSFLRRWPEVKELTQRIQRGRSAAQARIKENLGARTMMEGLADASAEFGDVVREAGFSLDEEVAAVVAVQARRILDMRHLEETVVNPEMRRAVAAYVNVMPAEVNTLTLWELLRGRGSARWYYEKLNDKGITVRLSSPESAGNIKPTGLSEVIDIDRARDLAQRKARQSALTVAERRSAGAGGGPDMGGGMWGIGERMTWLVIVAMLVCVVGVANAMLMSVTERFREIATLKCLGALDGSIMLMFVAEAALLGVVGGVAGAIMGSIIGLGRMLARFGGLLFTALPAGELLFAILISTASGVILAGVAALYPSYRAARLAPMEAMRIQ